MKLPYVDILGVRVSAISGEEMLKSFQTAIENNRQAVFAYVNAHALNLARETPWFRSFLNDADAAYPDGEGVRFGARLLGRRLPPTTALTRWIWNLAAFCDERRYTLFLLGSTDRNCAAAAMRLKSRFPRLRVVHHHGFFSDVENNAVLEAIRAVKPHVLLVGLGMPKQEEWILRNRERIAANVILPGGSAIDFAAGIRPVCPRWLSRLGLEWLFRLVFEPRRLFRRYSSGNIQFLRAVLAQRSRDRRRKRA